MHDGEDDEHVQHLKAKKEELEKRVKEKTKQQENLQVRGVVCSHRVRE